MNDPASLFRSAVIAFKDGQICHALSLLEESCQINPAVPQCHSMLGLIFEQTGKIDEAIAAYARALELEPDNLKTLAAYKRCIEQKPDAAEAFNHLAIALAQSDRPQHARDCFDRAIKLDPMYAAAHNNLGLLLKSMAQHDQAIQCYRRATEIDPDYANAQWNLSLALLVKGHFIEGWQQFRWRRKANLDAILDSQRQNPPTWDGSPFRNKTLLIRYEQGLGDNIQCMRYVPLIKKLGGSVIVESLQPLLGLFRQIQEIDQLVEASSDGRPTVDFDLFAFALDLPGIFNTDLHNIPANIPYLYADIDRANEWHKRISCPEFKIGIVWAGSPKHTNDHNRSCELGFFGTLAEIPNLRLFSLQKGPAESALHDPAYQHIHNMAHLLHDFSDTSAAIENMDLVISVDTAVLHLAGAMGKPVWALLPSVPDWRWLLTRADSPWYPSMRLFRQAKPGDWESVLDCVCKELRQTLCK
jgi:tetratricopeptide (TPR) repeat protein